MKNKGLLQFPHPFFSERPSWKWFILLNVLIGATMSALDVSIVNVAMPTLKTEFHTSMAVIEWVAMSYMITLTVLLPFFGRLADVLGRSKLYNLGFIIFTVGSWFWGMATSASFIIAARVLQAVGAGLLQANSVALITQAFPGNERGKAIGIQGAVQAISMAIGPFVGGILISAVGWRLVFYINIPIGIVGTMAAMFILPSQEKSTVRQKIDYLGTAFFATGLACFALLFVGHQGSVWLLVAELIVLGIGMGMFTPPNNSAIMGAAPREKLGLAGGILNMMRSLGLIFGVDISGLVFTSLEHKYLSTHGYQHVAHVFQDGRIPLAMKDLRSCAVSS
ncbi:MAG: MFS transporter [Syntrophobacteraceae bacterium]|nr:MFS transporter [Syntrophobacteraceae bacterium]